MNVIITSRIPPGYLQGFGPEYYEMLLSSIYSNGEMEHSGGEQSKTR